MIEDISKNYSPFDLIPKSIGNGRIISTIHQLMKQIKELASIDDINNISKMKLCEKVAINLSLFNDKESTDAIDLKLDVVMSTVDIPEIINNLKKVNPQLWFKIVNEALDKDEDDVLNGKYKILYQHLYLDFIHLFSDEGINKYFGKESNEALNKLLGRAITVLNQYLIRNIAHTQIRLQIFESACKFFIEHTWLDRYSEMEKKKSVLIADDGINNFGNIDKLSPYHHDCYLLFSKEWLVWDIVAIDNYLAEDETQIRLDYKVAEEWIKFMEEESKLFLDSNATKEIMTFVKQFHHIKNTKDKNEKEFQKDYFDGECDFRDMY